MKLDYIDLFYCHSYDYETLVEETLRTLDDFIKQGKILYAGISNWNSEQITHAIKLADSYLLNRIIVHQCEYSLLKRDIETSIIPVSKEVGVSQIVFSPLAQGILTGKYNDQIPKSSRATNPNVNKFFKKLYTNHSVQKARKLGELACSYDMALTELALKWVLREDNVASALVGASNPNQIAENIKAVLRQLDAKMLNEIQEIIEAD